MSDTQLRDGETDDPTPDLDTQHATSNALPAVSRRGFFGQLATAGVALTGVPLLEDETDAQTPNTSAHATKTATADALSAKTNVTLKINGKPQTLEIEPNVTLLDALRERLDMTGTKKGCNHGQCGACTVLINGRRTLSCLSLALAYEGDEITTVEGLATGEELHPVQAAFIQYDAYQCGYCTPGQLCSMVGAIAEAKADMPSHVTPDVKATFKMDSLNDLEIRERMSGNICRCGAYANIVEAFKSAAKTPGATK